MKQSVLVNGRKCTFQDWTRAKVWSPQVLFQARMSASRAPGRTIGFWKLERVRTGVELRDALLNSLTSWRKSLGQVEVSSPSRAASRAVRCEPPPVDTLFAEYVEGMNDDLQDRVVVPDDKGKSMACWVPRQQCCQSVFDLFHDDRENFAQFPLNEVQTIQACRTLHFKVAEGLRMKVSAKSAWKAGCLPNSYGTINLSVLTRARVLKRTMPELLSTLPDTVFAAEFGDI